MINAVIWKNAVQVQGHASPMCGAQTAAGGGPVSRNLKFYLSWMARAGIESFEIAAVNLPMEFHCSLVARHHCELSATTMLAVIQHERATEDCH